MWDNEHSSLRRSFGTRKRTLVRTFNHFFKKISRLPRKTPLVLHNHLPIHRANISRKYHRDSSYPACFVANIPISHQKRADFEGMGAHLWQLSFMYMILQDISSNSVTSLQCLLKICQTYPNHRVVQETSCLHMITCFYSIIYRSRAKN